MENSRSHFSKTVFLLAWLLVTTVGWSLRILSMWFTRGEGALWSVRTLAEIPEVLLVTSISGLLAGLIMGFGQRLVLRSIRLNDQNSWLCSTLFGMVLLAPLGILISTSISWIGWGDNFLPESRTMFLILYPTHLIYGGFILGALQWLGLRNMLENLGWKEASLWIFGTWAGIGFGVFAGNVVSYSLFKTPTQVVHRFVTEQVITGVMIGIATGIILILIIQESKTKS